MSWEGRNDVASGELWIAWVAKLIRVPLGMVCPVESERGAVVRRVIEAAKC